MLDLLPAPKSALYLNRYKKIIMYATANPIIEGYKEEHHILPKSMFPEYKNEKSNLIYLNARQHFIAHYFLWKAYRTRKTYYAFRMMNCHSNKQKRYINSKLYSLLKEESISISENQKQKISKKLKGRIFSQETINRMSSWQKGKPKPWLKGKKRNQETINKMSSWQKGKPKPKTTGSLNGNSKSIIYKNVLYNSISECVKITGMSKYKIHKNI